MDFPAALRQALGSCLPGVRAHRQYAPELAYGRHQGPQSADAREAAVLALFFPRDQGWTLVLTLRPDHLPDHPGQVSFPGGALKAGESAEQGALRELNEELGVATEHVELVGRLSPIYVFNSNFSVQPIVGMLAESPVFRRDASEVAEVIEVPLAALLKWVPEKMLWRLRPSVSLTAPAVSWQHQKVWGATLLILGELIELLRENYAQDPVSSKVESKKHHAERD
ncbi:MAG: coenzyme A pyrophosphatase [Planctomycetaceae bacterium]|nr:coenzyme A pyrophosphatase [Planctomycetaceae bacterium]HAA68526.1 coenzyme A pyrophosphatase [Planctomycetaceae bacterium]